MQYKNDNEIEKEFFPFKIIKIEFRNHDFISGYIEIEFPNAEESVGGGTDYVCDSWIKYPHNNKIAFDNWYPEKVYFALCGAINNKIKKGKEKQ